MAHWLKWGSGSSHIHHDFEHLVQIPGYEYRALYDGEETEDGLLIVWVKKNQTSDLEPFLVDPDNGGFVYIEQKDAGDFAGATTEEAKLAIAKENPPE